MCVFWVCASECVYVFVCVCVREREKVAELAYLSEKCLNVEQFLTIARRPPPVIVQQSTHRL